MFYLVSLPWKEEGCLQVGDFFSNFHNGKARLRIETCDEVY